MSLPENPTLQDAELYAQHWLKYPMVLAMQGPNPAPRMMVLLYEEIVKLREALNGVTAAHNEADRGNRMLFPLPGEDS